MVDTTEYKVEELIEMWRDAGLDISDGEVRVTGYDNMVVEYEGKDGTLEVAYGVKDRGGYRSDTEEMFEIR